MAGGELHKSERDELGSIDYFLDHLARAVERGEVPRASYDLLAPRYLQRRSDLVSIITGGAPQAASHQISAPVPTPAPVPAPAQAPTPAPAVRPQRVPREPVPWTTVLTFTGAFLVIVASAIFAVATWDMFGVTFKLLFLGALTAGFYAAGRLVRTKLKLAGGGVALTVVASAMLLFDGWIAIDGFGWTGVWPWVVWLAACSAVYWYTETSMGSGFFGVTGAAAQVAWVWLLGDGLGWQDTQRAAAIALVAVGWALAGRMAKNRGPFASLAGVLRLAAPVTVLLSSLLCLGGVLVGETGWAEIVPALIVGVAATAIVQIAGLPPALGALAHLPAFIAIGSVHGGPDAGHAALLFGMAVAYVLYELYGGGWGHGVLALFAELGAWIALSSRFEWAGDVTLAVLVALAVSWSAAAWLIGRDDRDSVRSSGPSNSAGALSLRHITLYGGWALLTILTLLMPVVTEVIPLSGVEVLARNAALAGGILAAWFALASLHRFAPAAIGAFLMSFWAAAALLAWAFPAWHSAYYAIAMLAVAAKWLAGRHHVERVTGLPATVLAWIARGSTLLIVSLGLAAAEYYYQVVSLPSAWLLAATAAWWLLDALTAEEFRSGFAISSGLAVLAVALGVAARTEVDATAALGAALTALALVALGTWLRQRPGWGRQWVWGAAVTGVVASLLALDDPGSLAVALALAAAACILAAWTSGVVEAAAGGGLVVVGALIACAAWIDADPWVLFALVALPSLAMLAPPARARQGAPGTTLTRWFDAGLASGFMGISILVLIPLLYDGAYTLAGWADLGEHGLAAALLVLGAYVMSVSALKDFELGTYAGVGLVLAAYLVERGARNVGTAEWVSTPIALYIAWIGYQRARTHRTKVPLASDIGAAVVALAVPALLAATTFAGAEPWTHLVWAVALSLIAITAGVALRVRAYFFGGVAAIVFTAIVRSWVYLVSFWWLVLGLIGITMLVVALTWERQHSLVAGAKSRMQAALSDWR